MEIIQLLKLLSDSENTATQAQTIEQLRQQIIILAKAIDEIRGTFLVILVCFSFVFVGYVFCNEWKLKKLERKLAELTGRKTP